MNITVSPVQFAQVDELHVKVFADRVGMGNHAGNEIAKKVKRLLQEKQEIRVVFAAAPSQKEVLACLVQDKEIDWSRIVAFHMDEYLGLPEGASQSFGHFLSDTLFETVQPKKVYLLNGNQNGEKECRRYAALLNEKPIDIVCLGIGENGHIAFNDPPVADFKDPVTVKVVQLDKACRQQQVNDGCFTNLEEVPKTAITLTIPTLLSAKFLYCVVPGKRKAKAVRHVLTGPITTDWPASILRKHSHCILYVDEDAYGK